MASLSARRAWIEISVDWLDAGCLPRSLSARRAWIEIDAPSSAPYAELVALRKESVDRNDNGNAVAVSDLGRSPQGERG